MPLLYTYYVCSMYTNDVILNVYINYKYVCVYVLLRTIPQSLLQMKTFHKRGFNPINLMTCFW